MPRITSDHFGFPSSTKYCVARTYVKRDGVLHVAELSWQVVVRMSIDARDWDALPPPRDVGRNHPL